MEQQKQWTIYKGRPLDEQGRSLAELRVYDLLDELGIDYERVDHEAAMTMAACRDIDRLLHVHACKNLFLRNTQKTRFYLLLIAGDKKFKTKDLSAQLGIARLSFAEEEYMEKYLGVHPGSVTVMGLMNDTGHQVQLLIDRDVYTEDMTACHPCANTSSIRLKSADLLGKFIPYTGHEPIYVSS